MTDIISLIVVIIIILLVLWFLGVFVNFNNNNNGNAQTTRFSGDVRPAFEVPRPDLPAGTPPEGQVSAHFDHNNRTLTYNSNVRFTSGAVTAVHFHRGAVGVPGPVVKTLHVERSNNGWTTSGTWSGQDAVEPLTPSLISDLFNNRIYINYHTARNPNGEVRGQLFSP